MNMKGLEARVRKLEAKHEPKRVRYVVVDSEQELKEKQAQEKPGFEYVYVHWRWDGEEVEF